MVLEKLLSTNQGEQMPEFLEEYRNSLIESLKKKHVPGGDNKITELRQTDEEHTQRR